jgi:hypothetical protein
MGRDGMREKVDYFYCEECKEHVPCVRIAPGVWEVQCAKCIGECAVCGCHLARYCFGQISIPVEMRLRVVKLADKP